MMMLIYRLSEVSFPSLFKSCKILRFHRLQRRVIFTRGSPAQCHVDIFVNSPFLHGRIISHTVSQLVVSHVVIFYRVTS